MTLDWIGEQLCMGSAGHVSHLFYRSKSNPEKLSGEESQKAVLTPHSVHLPVIDSSNAARDDAYPVLKGPPLSLLGPDVG